MVKRCSHFVLGLDEKVVHYEKKQHMLYRDLFHLEKLKILLELENVFMKHYAPNW